MTQQNATFLVWELEVWELEVGPMTPKLEIKQDFCILQQATKFRHPTFNCSEVIVLTNSKTNTLLKTSTLHRKAMPVGNYSQITE